MPCPYDKKNQNRLLNLDPPRRLTLRLRILSSRFISEASFSRLLHPPTLKLADWLPYAVRRDLDRLAPDTLPIPSGRKARLEYRDDGSIFASVKLQELFGLADTPTVGPDRTPVTFSLLAPNGRPVQTTRDLRSFWNTTYAEVRKQLRGRYPKHPWPEDPWTATPTARTKRRR